MMRWTDLPPGTMTIDPMITPRLYDDPCRDPGLTYAQDLREFIEWLLAPVETEEETTLPNMDPENPVKPLIY